MHHLELLNTEEGMVRDIGVPILEGKAGIVRIGITDRSLKHAVWYMTWQVVLTTIIISILGILGTFYLTKILMIPIRRLVKAANSVALGDLTQYQSMTKYLLRQATKDQGIKKKGQSSKELSDRETEVLKLIALGYTNQEIAEQLVISIKSVETYKTRLMDKLELRRRSELVRYATEQGILSVSD